MGMTKRPERQWFKELPIRVSAHQAQQSGWSLPKFQQQACILSTLVVCVSCVCVCVCASLSTKGDATFFGRMTNSVDSCTAVCVCVCGPDAGGKKTAYDGIY